MPSWVQGLGAKPSEGGGGGCQFTCRAFTFSMPMAFMSRTTPSRAVFRISGGVCSMKMSLKTAEENNLTASRKMRSF
jgi:hypothetical protein